MFFLELLLAALPDIDEVTLVRAKKGDEAALASLLSFYEKRVYAVALRVLGNGHDAFDAAQDSLIKIYRNTPAFKGTASFSSWVYRVTVNTCYDMLKRRSRKDASMDDEEAGLDLRDEAAYADPERMLVSTELGRQIAEALKTLPDEQRTAVVLCDVEGLSYEEIAETLELSIGTVKSRIFRGREKLRALLSDKV